MKQFLLLTDTHLSDNNIPLVTDIFTQAINICNERGIKDIYHLGDWFTSRKSQSLAVLKATERIIGGFRTAGITCRIIKGNHDSVESDTEDSYLDIFDSIHFTVYRNGTFIPEDKINIFLLPYFKESGSYGARLAKLIPEKGKVNILLTHAGLNGVKNNDGSAVVNDLYPDKFKGFTVISGHYHNFSKIGEDIFYMGSAYQGSYGEDDNKGFVILSEDGSLEWIKSRFPKYIKHTIDISNTQEIKRIQKEYAHSTDNVRIVFTGDETQLASLNKEKFNALGIDVKFDKEIIRQDLSAVLDSNINFDRSNIKQAFEQFCSLNEFTDTETGLNYLQKLEL